MQDSWLHAGCIVQSPSFTNDPKQEGDCCVVYLLCSSYKNNYLQTLYYQFLTFLNSVDKWKKRRDIKCRFFYTIQCSSGCTERATCCMPSPSWPSLRPCPWSSHFHPDTWGSTTCPWAYDGARHRRNETIRWDIHRYRSQSSRRRTPAHTGSMLAHLDRWAGQEVTLLSQTSPLTFSSSLKMFWLSFPAKPPHPLPQRGPDPRNFPDSLRFSDVLSVSLRTCLHHLILG